MSFEWDPKKAASNAAKHGVTFEEATQVFAPGVVAMEIEDEKHSAHEKRWLRVGPVVRGVVLVVWTSRRENVIRIVSARFASRVERAFFLEWMKDRP
jgi:hypothetical protein